MNNLAYLALTTLKRDKRTIINGIMMLVCFCGLNLILLLITIRGSRRFPPDLLQPRRIMLNNYKTINNNVMV